MKDQSHGPKKPIFPSEIILDRYTHSPIVTFFMLVGAVRYGYPLRQICEWRGLAETTVRDHLELLGFEYGEVKEDHRPQRLKRRNAKEVLNKLWYDKYKKPRPMHKIAEYIPDEILTLLYEYLYDHKMNSMNRQLLLDFKRQIKQLSTSKELKTMLTLALAEFQKDPSHQWFKAIVAVLKDIEAGKLKNTGDQEDGSRIVKIHLSPPDVDLLDRNGVSLENLTEYALRQYRAEVSRQLRQANEVPQIPKKT